MQASSLTLACRSTSAILTVRGSAAAMRTPTDCCASTSPKAPISTCTAPRKLAGKSTLNRLELSRVEPTRYQKISHDAAAIESLFVDLFLDAHKQPPQQIILDL